MGTFRRTVQLLLCLLFVAPAFGAINSPLRVDSGLLRGVPLENSSVTVFRGIPFAAPPVGDLRWRAPRPVAPWNGVRQANAFGNDCSQAKTGPIGPWSAEFMPHSAMEGGSSEDCLYLNVWTPAKASGEKRPVFVWIHGGGFTAGSGGVPVYDGEGLAGKGLVVVTINYRLGVFGFLAHPELSKESDHHASGDYGLLDMIAALRWVQKNIGAFGGDPGNVTIAGQSAGAFAVNYLVASPLAKGLFERAIAESGGAFSRDRTLKEGEQAGLQFSQAHKASTIADLRALSASDLLQHTPGEPRFGPIVDGYVVPRDVRSIFEAGHQNDVPMLLGWNLNDGVMFGPAPTAEAFRAEAAKNYGDMAPEFLKAFPADTDIQAAASQKALARDPMFAWQAHTWARLQQKTGKAKVYVYEFTRVAPGDPEQRRYGAFHSGELAYALNTLPRWHRPWEPTDRKISELMSAYWVNFARSGDPNGAGLPSWPAYTAQADRIMSIGEQTQAVPTPHKAELGFLDEWNSKQRSGRPGISR